jgi:hypothetical protein
MAVDPLDIFSNLQTVAPAQSTEQTGFPNVLEPGNEVPTRPEDIFEGIQQRRQQRTITRGEAQNLRSMIMSEMRNISQFQLPPPSIAERIFNATYQRDRAAAEARIKSERLRALLPAAVGVLQQERLLASPDDIETKAFEAFLKDMNRQLERNRKEAALQRFEAEHGPVDPVDRFNFLEGDDELSEESKKLTPAEINSAALAGTRVGVEGAKELFRDDPVLQETAMLAAQQAERRNAEENPPDFAKGFPTEQDARDAIEEQRKAMIAAGDIPMMLEVLPFSARDPSTGARFTDFKETRKPSISHAEQIRQAARLLGLEGRLAELFPAAVAGTSQRGLLPPGLERNLQSAQEKLKGRSGK